MVHVIFYADLSIEIKICVQCAQVSYHKFHQVKDEFDLKFAIKCNKLLIHLLQSYPFEVPNLCAHKMQRAEKGMRRTNVRTGNL